MAREKEMLSRCVERGLGKPEYKWIWPHQGMWKIEGNYFGQKRKAKECCPLKIEKGELATIAIDKTEAFNMLFVYIYQYVICLTGS